MVMLVMLAEVGGLFPGSSVGRMAGALTSPDLDCLSSYPGVGERDFHHLERVIAMSRDGYLEHEGDNADVGG